MPKPKTTSKSEKFDATDLSRGSAESTAGDVAADPIARPEPFFDSLTTVDACFSVEVKEPWGEEVQDIEVKIDCGGMIHGDEGLIDALIEMLEAAKENLAVRCGRIPTPRPEEP